MFSKTCLSISIKFVSSLSQGRKIAQCWQVKGHFIIWIIISFVFIVFLVFIIISIIREWIFTAMVKTEEWVGMIWVTGRVWALLQMFYEHAVSLAHALKLFSGTRVIWIFVWMCTKGNLKWSYINHAQNMFTKGLPAYKWLWQGQWKIPIFPYETSGNLAKIQSLTSFKPKTAYASETSREARIVMGRKRERQC